MRFILYLFAAGTLVIGGYLVVLYGFTPYSVLGPALDAANKSAELASAPWLPQPLAHNALAYARLQVLAFALALLGAGGLLYGRSKAFREARRLVRDLQRARRAVATTWRRQPRAVRGASSAGLLAVAALRTFLLGYYPFNADEIVSIDYFVAPGPAVTAGFYLLPNNHLLQNLLAWPLLHYLPAGMPDLLLRLPVFALGLVGLGLGFLVLLHLTGWRVALLATLLFNFSPMALEYAVTARGYGLQALCVQAGLLATLVLLRGPGSHRLAWAVWVVACVAGLYLIPTFVYPFASLGIGLVAAQGRHAHCLRWQVLAAGSAVAILACVLYLPVGWLTGWHLLLANPFVAARLATSYWHDIASYYFPATMLVLYGNAVFSWLLLFFLVGAVLMLPYARASLKLLGWLSLIGLVAPMPLFLVQHVMPPGRTLHYTVWLTVLLLGVVTDTLSRLVPVRAAWVWSTVAVLGGGYTLFRLAAQANLLVAARHQEQSHWQAARGLAAQQPGSVLVAVPGFELYLSHRALMEHRPAPHLQVLNQTTPRRNYDFLVLPLASPPPAWLAWGRYKPLFCNGMLCVYRRVR